MPPLKHEGRVLPSSAQQVKILFMGDIRHGLSTFVRS
jgi:hypothetical protein